MSKPKPGAGSKMEKKKRVRHRVCEGPKPQRAYEKSRLDAKDKEEATRIRQVITNLYMFLFCTIFIFLSQAKNARKTRERQKAEREALNQEISTLKSENNTLKKEIELLRCMINTK